MSDESTPTPSQDKNPANGRFVKGNKAAKINGNEVQRKLHALRKMELSAISQKDVKQVIKKLIEIAKQGDIKAIKLFIERACGRMPQVSEIAVASDDNGEPRKITIQLEGRDNHP